MLPEEVRKILADAETLDWKTSLIREDNRIEKWIAVAKLFERDPWVGISQSGFWVRQLNNYIVVFVEENQLVGLMACLERPIKEIKALLIKGLEAINVPIEVAESFPFSGIVYTAFISKSDYWTTLAFDWLEEVTFTDLIASALLDLRDSKWASQRNRQKAKKFLRRHHRL
jgi:hypothetical protein